MRKRALTAVPSWPTCFFLRAAATFEDMGADAGAVAAHPGTSSTNLGNHLYDR